jgi:aminopeptidase
MIEDFAPKMAQVLTEYSIPIQKGDYVVIFGSMAAEPLVLALYEAVLRRGGHPTVRVEVPDLYDIFYDVAGDEQLDFCDPLDLAIYEKMDVLFDILAPSNTRSRASADPKRLARHRQGRRPIIELYFKRIGDQSLRWNISAWPTQAAAQEAEMGLLAYRDFVYRACGLDQPDPVAYWAALRERGDKLANWLNGRRRVEVRGPGIDLAFDLTGRLWINCWGDMNFPDGEIFTGPVENSVNGHVEFNFPTVDREREVSGVKLVFKDGAVVEASASKGEDYLLSQLDLDAGARRLGEFAIGTNPGIQRFTGEALFDEKIGGTIHMALGQSIPESGGVNESMVHWDMVHGMQDGGEIVVDGELFYRGGKFMV